MTTIGLPVALGIIMFGLGLSLTPGDFARVVNQPKAVILALLCQLILLPAIWADSTGRRNTLIMEVLRDGDEVLVCEDERGS